MSFEKYEEKNTDALYGLRFILISLLILFHMGVPNTSGALCVASFTILSGFLIGYSNQKKVVSYSWRSVWEFYKRRLKKIYPLYFLATCLSLIIMVCFTHEEFSINDLLRHLLMVKTWLPIEIEKSFWFGGAIWYISLIWFCYLITPIIYTGGGVYRKKNPV